MNYKKLFFNSKGEPAAENLVIIGVNPIIEALLDDTRFIADTLRVNPELRITIYYENDTENFNQSLFYDKARSLNKLDFNKLTRNMNRLVGNKEGKGGLVDLVLNHFEKAERDGVRSRIALYQNNLRQFANIVLADDTIRYCFTTLEVPSTDLYIEVNQAENKALFDQLKKYIEFLGDDGSGGKFVSKAGDELIQLYDKENYPRGIYPRKAFYTTSYKRYSIWAFIFNRKGELLLHKRSEYTKDNRALWDKSAGGHVDLKDRSTIITAMREVVEELFLTEAEYTKYWNEKIKDFIDFGQWDTESRPESYFFNDFEGLGEGKWVVFRPIDRDTDHPMTIDRKSARKMQVIDPDENGNKVLLVDGNKKPVLDGRGKPMYREKTETWNTLFISDVFLFIAPEDHIDNMEQVNALMSAAEAKGAASAHRLVEVDDLIDEVQEYPGLYTDDLVYMVTEKAWLLTQFSEFIKSVFNRTE